MWITGCIGVRVMDSMCYDPIDGAAFERERATHGQKVLDQLWRLEATMS